MHVRRHPDINRIVEPDNSGKGFRLVLFADGTEVLKRKLDPQAEFLRQTDDITDVRNRAFIVLADPFRHDIEKGNAEPDADEVSAVLRKICHPGPVSFQHRLFRHVLRAAEEAEVAPDRKIRFSFCIRKIPRIDRTDVNKFFHSSFPLLWNFIWTPAAFRRRTVFRRRPRHRKDEK